MQAREQLLTEYYSTQAPRPLYVSTDRVIDAVNRGILTPNEARERLGLEEPGPSSTLYYSDYVPGVKDREGIESDDVWPASLQAIAMGMGIRPSMLEENASANNRTIADEENTNAFSRTTVTALAAMMDGVNQRMEYAMREFTGKIEQAKPEPTTDLPLGGRKIILE